MLSSGLPCVVFCLVLAKGLRRSAQSSHIGHARELAGRALEFSSHVVSAAPEKVSLQSRGARTDKVVGIGKGLHSLALSVTHLHKGFLGAPEQADFASFPSNNRPLFGKNDEA